MRGIDLKLDTHIFRKIMADLCAHVRGSILNACISFDFLNYYLHNIFTNWLVLIEAEKPSLSKSDEIKPVLYEN